MDVHASYQIDKDIRQLNPESLFEATMYWCLTKYLRYVHWLTLVIRVLNQQIASLKTDFDSSLELGVSVDRASNMVGKLRANCSISDVPKVVQIANLLVRRSSSIGLDPKSIAVSGCIFDHRSD